jgi:hypothetical protein
MSRLKYHDFIVEICNQGGKISSESIFPLLEGQDIDVLNILFPKHKTFLPPKSQSIDGEKIRYQIRTIRFEDDLFYIVDKDGNLIMEKNNKTEEEIEKIKLNILNPVIPIKRSNSGKKKYSLRQTLPKTDFYKEDLSSNPFPKSHLSSVSSSKISPAKAEALYHYLSEDNDHSILNDHYLSLVSSSKISPAKAEALYHYLSEDNDNSKLNYHISTLNYHTKLKDDNIYS